MLLGRSIIRVSAWAVRLDSFFFLGWGHAVGGTSFLFLSFLALLGLSAGFIRGGWVVLLFPGVRSDRIRLFRSFLSLVFLFLVV